MAKTMDRKIIIMLAVLTLAFASLAQAKLDRIEEAFELHLTQLSLPAHATGKVTVKACAGCDTVQLRVNARTSYHVGIGSTAITLQELIDAVYAVHDRSKTPVYVMYKAEDLVITRIILGAASR